MPAGERSRITGTRRSHPLQVPDQESPLWLPSIANPGTSRNAPLSPGGTLPKVGLRHRPAVPRCICALSVPRDGCPGGPLNLQVSVQVPGVPQPRGTYTRRSPASLFSADDIVQAAGSYNSPTMKRKSKFLGATRDPAKIATTRLGGSPGTVKLPPLPVRCLAHPSASFSFHTATPGVRGISGCVQACQQLPSGHESKRRHALETCAFCPFSRSKSFFGAVLSACGLGWETVVVMVTPARARLRAIGCVGSA